eukprot:COSAG04_NODE_2376_length_4245_cov_2.906175_4_plen_51_part_00
MRPRASAQLPCKQLQVDVINLQSLKDGRMKYVMNIIDVATRYTVQEALKK